MINIYIYTNKINGKVYVGQTNKSLSARAGIDGKDYQRCIRFYRAIQKYGWANFQSKVLIVEQEQKLADLFESTLIEILQATNPKFGYNIREGGSRGLQSEETKLKISLAKKGKPMSAEHKRKLSDYMKGRKIHLGYKHSPESKAKCGHPQTAETIQKMQKLFSGKTWKLIDGKRVWLDKTTT